ncbi:MAG: ABC transporter permease [Lachnospira sp.]|nr:ABC transporter permease [Lachnospira sp.]
MDKRLFNVTLLSIKRRWREVARTFIAAFLAVFFVTGILIFEENMYEWQIASNKDRFGNWFVMEANVSVQSEALKNHPKLDGYSEVVSAVNLCNERFRENGSHIGYMSPEFIKMGCIDVVHGRMPEADNEVAMDWNTLSKHGYSSPEVGQTITIRYYEGNESASGKRVEEEMTLVGIVEDYSNVWYRSDYLPGALVTKEKYESFGNNKITAYIYQLAESERNGDYRAIYDEILSQINTKPAYNMYVYDYKPWSSDNVYNYMYVLIMVIAIAALTYQLLVYKNSRKGTFDLMRRLGATKWQVTSVSFVENVMMLLPAGVIGIGMAVLVGRLVCLAIELNMGINFFYINAGILCRGLLAIVFAVIASEVAGLLITFKQVLLPKKVARTVNIIPKSKSTLGVKGAYRTISFRFTNASKLSQNLGIRVFSLVICVVIVMCGLRIYETYRAYESSKENVDLNGVTYVDKEYVMKVPYYVSVENNAKAETALYLMSTGNMDPTEYMVDVTQEQIDMLIESGDKPIYEPESQKNVSYEYPVLEMEDGKILAQLYLPLSKGRFYKDPKTNFTKGLTDNDINVIENVVGVESVEYSTYESQRSWWWQGMSLAKMGYTRLADERTGTMVSVQPYASYNLFATEYLSATEELYARLCKYIDPSMQDYDAFAKGEQVLILLEENPYGEYDDTLTAGKIISYGYDDLVLSRESADEIYAYDAALAMCLREQMYETYIDSKGRERVRMKSSYKATYNEYLRRILLESCVQTKAAAVVRVTDEVKAEFADMLPSNSYYTAIASTQLAEKICDSQNKALAEFMELDTLPEECRAKVAYNQVVIKYNMLASFSATDNIISRYCEENDIDYISRAAENEKYRTDFINALLQYGITIIAVMVINVLISAIIVQNRLVVRKKRIELLLRLGAEHKNVRKVFMIESVREALWCVFTLPVVLLVQYGIYRRNI